MEINELSNNAFDFHETTMDDQQILHYNQINDLDSLLPYFPFQPHNIIDNQQHLPSSSFPSSQLLSTPLPLDTTATDQDHEPEQEEELGAMKEMMYKIAAMQPVDIDPSTIRKPKRRNVRISDDPQSIAARLRRERISEKIRILQRLVPGGTKMDTASMLDEAIRYVKFLKRQIRLLQSNQPPPPQPSIGGSSSTTTVGWPFTIHKGNASMGEKSLY